VRVTGLVDVPKRETPRDIRVQATVIQILESHRFPDVHSVSHAKCKIRPQILLLTVWCDVTPILSSTTM
jgi:hypothetical protein